MSYPKPAVLFVGNHLAARGRNPGPSEALAEKLRRAGWPVSVTSPRLSRVARVSDMLASIWRLRDRYELAHVDLFSGNSFLWAEAACGALRGLGKPYAITLHGGNLPSFASRWPRRMRWMLDSAAFVAAPSPYLVRLAAGQRRDVRWIPNAIDLGAYSSFARVGVRPRLIWLRAFHRIYHPELAVEAVARLTRLFPGLNLTMVGPDKGDGSYERTRQAARRLGVSDCIRFPGAIPQATVPLWLERADIFLNTSRIDNSPVSVVQAMAAGLCVVSTRVGGLPDLLRHEENALLVPAEDPEAMADAVARLLVDRVFARRLSTRARRSVEPHDWAHVLPQWEQLFFDLGEQH